MTTTIRTPQGNVPYTYQLYTNPAGYNKYNYYRNTSSGKSGYDYTIIFKNDSVVQAFTKIDVSDSVRRIEIKEGKAEFVIKPHDTKRVYRVCKSGQRIIGMPTDSCWLFKVGEGKINSYSVLPYEYNPVIVAIQQGKDGPIIPLSKEILKKIIGDDPKLTKLIEKKKFNKVIELYNAK